MAQVTVLVDGKSYRLACDDGQEAHLVGLANAVDGKLKTLKGQVGEIGDLRLMVMTSIMMADEAEEIRTKLAAIEATLASMQSENLARDAAAAARERGMTEAIDAVAQRMARIAETLGG
ncbi:MAG: cell division protein ZapA [Beijerinckiaceae bacterium]